MHDPQRDIIERGQTAEGLRNLIAVYTQRLIKRGMNPAEAAAQAERKVQNAQA